MPVTDNSILFLDAEFVDNQEVIELSVWNHQGVEVYHEFFRPEGIDEWPVSENVHHISPADVAGKPSFSSCKKKIQDIFDGAEYIVGFATSGDVAHLKESGIRGFDRKKIIDIKHIFWLYVGIERDMDFYGIPGLSKVAEILEVSFGEKGAHSASEDTLVTLKCFNRLAELIPGYSYDSRTPGSFQEAMRLFQESFAVAKEDYERKKAHGWIHVTKTGDKGIYKLLFKKWEPEESDQLLGKVEVGDLSKAESDIIGRFQRKMLQGRRGTFRLSKKDLNELLSYTNEFGNEEEHNMSKKLLMLQKIYR